MYVNLFKNMFYPNESVGPEQSEDFFTVASYSHEPEPEEYHFKIYQTNYVLLNPFLKYQL